MADISVKTFTEQDVADFLKNSQAEYGSSSSTDSNHVRWKHLGSPFGASSYICLVEAGRTVGRILVQQRPLRTTSGVIQAACPLDLLIDREHRKTPLNFIQMTKASSEIPNVDVIYHTSNEKSFPLYSQLLRFPNPFSLKAYGFPLFTAPWRGCVYLFANMLALAPGVTISQTAISDSELNELVKKCLGSGPLLERTNAFLKWRFKDAPLWPGEIYRIDHQGQFLGYFVTRRVELNGRKHLVLMDFLIDPEAPSRILRALRFWLLRLAISSRADVLFTMVNPGNTMARRVVGFPMIRILDRFLPHKTPIFIRAHRHENKAFEGDGSIHLTLADLDYF